MYHELWVESVVSDEHSDVMRNEVVHLLVDVGVHAVHVFDVGISLLQVE